MMKTIFIITLAFFISMVPYVSMAQTQEDYQKMMAELVGEWNVDNSSVETNMFDPSEMPESKLVVTNLGEFQNKVESHSKDESGNWTKDWSHVETFDPEQMVVNFEGTDATGDYHGTITLDEEGVQHIKQYNSADQKTMEGTIDGDDTEFWIDLAMYTDQEGNITDSSMGKMKMKYTKM